MIVPLAALQDGNDVPIQDLWRWISPEARALVEAVLAFVALAAVVAAVMRAVAKPRVAPTTALVGAVGTALTRVSRDGGRVRVGELTTEAVADVSIPAGAPVRVLAVAGLVAKVALDTSAKA